MNIEDMEIIAQIEAQENIAYGVNDSALSNDRAEAIDYYLGQPFGNEEEGRSQVVSYDVQDTIESALPQLLKVFVAGDKVVQFDPKGPEDQEAADQETDYINHVVMEQKNPLRQAHLPILYLTTTKIHCIVLKNKLLLLQQYKILN